MEEGATTGKADRTRQALLDAGASLAEEHGLAGLSVNMVVARAGVAKGAFYVHFKDRAAFVDAMHERFHASVQAAVVRDLPTRHEPAERLEDLTPLRSPTRAASAFVGTRISTRRSASLPCADRD